MSRYTRNSTILAKIETVYGTDSTPTGAANAILVSDLSITPIANNVPRDLILAYLGASEELVGTRYLQIGCTVELQGSGTAGTEPAWDPLLRACGFASSVEATPDRVEWVPITTSMESVTIYYYADGVLREALGCRGNVSFDLAVGSRPTMTFSFVGIDNDISAASPTGVDYSSFVAPLVVTDDNVANFLLGCTEADGSLSSGTAFTSRGMTIDMGNNAVFVPTLNGESADITQRAATGQMTLDLTAAQEVTMVGEIQANTTTSVGMELGSVAGKVIVVYAPAVQRINPTYEDVDGRSMVAMDLRFIPSSGNDEILIVQK